MKNFFLVLASVLFLASCDSKEKFQGRWSNYYLKQSSYPLEIRSVVIKNDSITFNYPYFEYSNSYSLNTKKGKLSFNDLNLKAFVKKDTLSINDSIYFVRDEVDTLYNSDILIKIDLPKVLNQFTQKLNKNNLNTYIYFGKRIDNQEFGLQLNDKFAKVSDLPVFVFVRNCHSSKDYSSIVNTVLSMDNTTPLNHLEDILYYLSMINYRQIDLVNDISLKFNDTVGLYYDYEVLNRTISHCFVHSSYNTNRGQMPPPPFTPYYPLFEDINLKSKFIHLKKNQLFHQDNVISTSELKTIIKPWIENNNVVFSLYDLESNYGKFLEMTAIINSVYEEVREKASQEQFNKSIESLSKEELREIKTKTPMHHVWSYSIPHFNHVVKRDKSFFDLKIN